MHDKVCQDCGTKHELNLHHICPSDKEGYRIWTWREERRIKEISKCIILCASCHRKTHARLDGRSLIVQFSVEGNYIAEFDSIKIASEITDVDSTNISRCCNRERKTAGGYVWKFKADSLKVKP